jgi:proteic killer suppression protein
MIKSFKHKGVARLFETGSASGVQAAHKARLARQLLTLNRAKSQQDMNQPGWKLHPLKGDEAGVWSVTVSGNWRLTFMFEGEDAILVDYRDYH